jgi:hypothetical protein
MYWNFVPIRLARDKMPSSSPKILPAEVKLELSALTKIAPSFPGSEMPSISVTSIS